MAISSTNDFLLLNIIAIPLAALPLYYWLSLVKGKWVQLDTPTKSAFVISSFTVALGTYFVSVLFVYGLLLFFWAFH
jgi:hypothetical protein